jgi:hypothetical protein
MNLAVIGRWPITVKFFILDGTIIIDDQLLLNSLI